VLPKADVVAAAQKVLDTAGADDVPNAEVEFLNALVEGVDVPNAEVCGALD
jgi:hypothetical protein